ncbi:MAG: hypothetical protein A2946_02200 [Candidatus Liptonbacteria bacterium RIFCSPLOWO2_01_FULL_53_13]|uniref:Uncharacterized protein n=1 Tax=Candidatus Liptonbacteria bacterium RIFCSPLOWO2_01_FULL_53_13 TaxID=1798651 RepID=A0A1G2CGL0_9BACT|nr:MAG: hypothetical protein A2946_02200 [Candidatus Liptonbacteria bacterium RIFCSPLOWO2_01_FULL_53_13]
MTRRAPKEHIELVPGAPFYHERLFIFERIRQFVWDIIFPFFPFVRDFLIAVGIVRHHVERQDYHIGYLAPGKTPEGLRAHLLREGFDADRIAWIDKEESIGLRRRVSFHYQYHLRLFSDGELRGHYELTPEASPFGHLLEWEFCEKKNEFTAFLDGWVA